MALSNRINGIDALREIRIDAAEGRAFGATVPVTATPGAAVTVAAALEGAQLAGAVVTAAGVGAAVGVAVD